MNEPEPNSAEDFAQRFNELCGEAKNYGVTSVYALIDENPLMKGDGEDVMLYSWRGGYYAAVGMASNLVDALKSHRTSDKHPQ